MFGFLYVAFCSFRCGIESLKVKKYNNDSIKRNVEKGRDTYIDFNGNRRRISNNHKVSNLHYTKNNEWCSIDLKTGEELINYTKLEKEKSDCQYKKGVEIAKKYTEKSKKYSLDNGYYCYEKSVAIRDDKKTSGYRIEKELLRVSDDLPVIGKIESGFIMDKKYHLILFIPKETYKYNDLFKIYREKNIKKINDENFLKKHGINKSEMLIIANRLGAIL